ncbi:hypothetical protein GQ473_05660 [archaeon]|nr:hypothetical protein [archaeon]
MDAIEFAVVLHGCQIGDEVSKEMELIAKENNLVVVFVSDDLMEFRGAIDDELDAYECTIAYIDRRGLIINKCDCDDCPYHATELIGASAVQALWCATDEYSWTFETSITHFVFDVMDGDKKYCQGIVFSLAYVG